MWSAYISIYYHSKFAVLMFKRLRDLKQTKITCFLYGTPFIIYYIELLLFIFMAGTHYVHKFLLYTYYRPIDKYNPVTD